MLSTRLPRSTGLVNANSMLNDPFADLVRHIR